MQPEDDFAAFISMLRGSPTAIYLTEMETAFETAKGVRTASNQLAAEYLHVKEKSIVLTEIEVLIKEVRAMVGVSLVHCTLYLRFPD